MEKYILIESEGLLFRGPMPNHPAEVWDYPRQRWVQYKDGGEQEAGWGKEITPAEADRLKTDNPDAEHYMYYDTPPWSQPVSQAYIQSILPESIKKVRARVRKIKT